LISLILKTAAGILSDDVEASALPATDAAAFLGAAFLGAAFLGAAFFAVAISIEF
jgi:hypothetical protein